MSTNSGTVRDDLTTPVVEFHRILVATDFSRGAHSALLAALAIARSCQSKVYLAHVVPEEVMNYASAETRVDVTARAKEYAAQQLTRLETSVEWGGVAHECILQQGPVWPVLRDTIQSHQVDLLAIGTHGRSSNQKILLGAVADEVFRTAEISTLTVGPRARRISDTKVEFQRLLFATNFTPHAERAAKLAYSLERRLNARIASLHVVEEAAALTGERQEIVREFILKRMRRGVPQACLQDCAPEFLVRFGDPATEILRAAEQQPSDLMILGLRAAKKSAGLLPSATAYKLVCQSPCPVVTHRR